MVAAPPAVVAEEEVGVAGSRLFLYTEIESGV